jgi:hypothetical protein
VDDANLDDKTLQQMIARVTLNEQFTASIADIKAGRGLETGKTQPVTSASVVKKPPTAKSKRTR